MRTAGRSRAASEGRERIDQTMRPSASSSAFRCGGAGARARLASDESVARDFGQEALNALWRHWNEAGERELSEAGSDTEEVP